MARILVVEDDEWYRALLVEMLRQDGHEVIEAGDGVQALAYLQSASADLMIIDMLMPNKDGVDTIMELQQLNLELPVVAISGGRRAVSAEFNLESARWLGVRAGLVKPFSRADLRGALAAAMA
ncbi:response regulator [Noviherbaspirillum pedocola]|uniref:Response regulator n=1 Tax=Noviherbaspirillum pedocola TaxID=2801341 RepID=A0A934T0V3_9BURK|nr:response regulator [Noviherbaspirillum pedocola]MBK4739339.1 response regulator [Noviherbaspirillum pedocola]